MKGNMITAATHGIASVVQNANSVILIDVEANFTVGTSPRLDCALESHNTATKAEAAVGCDSSHTTQPQKRKQQWDATENSEGYAPATTRNRTGASKAFTSDNLS